MEEMRVATVGSFFFILTVRLAAQAPADRAALERLRDSLGGVGDSLALHRFEQATIARAKLDRDNPLLHLRLGFIAVRLGELSNAKSHFDDAAGEFQWASELQPEWPYPWYGLGTAARRGARRRAAGGCLARRRSAHSPVDARARGARRGRRRLRCRGLPVVPRA